MREPSAPTIALTRVNRSLASEKVAQGVLWGSVGMLRDCLKDSLGQIRNKRLFSIAKEAVHLVGSSARPEAQPNLNIPRHCGNDVLDSLLGRGFVNMD